MPTPATYLSIAPFNTEIYELNYNKTSRVYESKVLSTATPQNCPAGRVLTITGPSVYHDNLQVVPFFFIPVTDPVSGLSGYINPLPDVFTCQPPQN